MSARQIMMTVGAGMITFGLGALIHPSLGMAVAGMTIMILASI